MPKGGASRFVIGAAVIVAVCFGVGVLIASATDSSEPTSQTAIKEVPAPPPQPVKGPAFEPASDVPALYEEPEPVETSTDTGSTSTYIPPASSGGGGGGGGGGSDSGSGTIIVPP